MPAFEESTVFNQSRKKKNMYHEYLLKKKGKKIKGMLINLGDRVRVGASICDMKEEVKQ